MSPAEIKQIIDSYVLLTFDIPACQGKLRKTVLKELAKIGAIAYTQSVYLLPLSEKSFELANDISAGGSAFVWQSKMVNIDKAQAITIKYDEHIHDRVAYIQQRLVQIKDHIDADRLGKANLMIKKTQALIHQLEQITESYNPPWLAPEIQTLKANLAQVYQK
jgi:hypothetical protein